MNVYLFVTSIRLLVVMVLVLLLVAAAAWADRRARRRLHQRAAAAAPRVAPAGNVDTAPACECQVEAAGAVQLSPTVVKLWPHRHAA